MGVGAVVRDSSPPPLIPSPFASSPRTLPAVTIDPTGSVYSTEILKQQLADELKLPLRDLRIVDPSFPNQIQATFIARPNVILFTLENIKVVVKHNEALVFNPLLAEVREFVPALQLQIQQAYRDSSIGGSRLDAPTSMRFEHVVIEAALNVVCNNLFTRLRALSPAIQSALAGLRAESRGLDIIQTQVDELLPLKNKLDELRKRVREIDRAVKDLLDTDEDMALMYLSTPTPQDPIETPHDSIGTSNDPIGTLKDPTGADAASPDHVSSGAFTGIDRSDDEPTPYKRPQSTMSLEMMLENYLNEVGWIASEVDEVLDTIINTEENVVLQLDLLRNRILKFELSLSISSFIVTSGALVTGLFGGSLHSSTHHHLSPPHIIIYHLLTSSSITSSHHHLSPTHIIIYHLLTSSSITIYTSSSITSYTSSSITSYSSPSITSYSSPSITSSHHHLSPPHIIYHLLHIIIYHLLHITIYHHLHIIIYHLLHIIIYHLYTSSSITSYSSPSITSSHHHLSPPHIIYHLLHIIIYHLLHIIIYHPYPLVY